MDHKSRLKELADFLQPYQKIWQNEIMLCYPDTFRDYPLEWVEELSNLTKKEELVRLEKKDLTEVSLSPSLRGYYQRIHELITIDRMPSCEAIPEGPFTFLYMIPKKEHEIRQLAPYIHQFYHQHKIKQVIDIGGGIGLLAQSLANQYDLPLTSLDMDSVLQTTGRDRHLINSRIPKNKVIYKNMKVSAEEMGFSELLSEETMTVGLHTCGYLAVDQIALSSQKNIKGIVNFGCCYHKLPDGGVGQNISSFAQTLPNPLVLGQYALTLASRAHKKMDELDYDFKLQVKKFRYAIHFLLIDKYGFEGMVNLGNSARSLYSRPFCEYAREQFKRLGIEAKHTDHELNAYFAEEKIQVLIRRMLAAGLIRDAQGRLLEMYLLLDRAIFLEERGYQAKLLEFFDENLSPRNLGLCAHRP